MELAAPKQVRTQETKQKIYKAAISILKKKGFPYLTVSNICSVAGVSNGTFFYHFKTKDELLAYYNFNKFAEYRAEHNFETVVKDMPFDEKILTFYSYWADYVEHVGLDFFSNYYNTSNASLDVRLWNRRDPVSIWNYPGECLKTAKEEGWLKPELSVDHCAVILATITKGVVFDWCLSNGATNMREAIREIMCPYLSSIRAGS